MIWIPSTMNSKVKYGTNKMNATIHYLGSLCKRGHDYMGTGHSLRYKKFRSCVLCSKQQHTKYIEDNQDTIIQYRQRYYKNNKTKILQKQIPYAYTYYWENKEDINAYQKFYREQHKVRISNKLKEYRKTTINPHTQDLRPLPNRLQKINKRKR